MSLLILLAALLPLTSAQAATTLALQPGADFAPPEYNVIVSNDQVTRLVIELPAVAIETFDLDGGTFQAVMVDGGELYGEVGQPLLPAHTRFVAIPAQSGQSLVLESYDEETLHGFHLLPMQDEESVEFQYDAQVYARDEFLGGEPVQIGAPSLMRDLRVIPVIFQPVRYNPATGDLRVVRRAEFRLEYAGVDLRSAKTRESLPLTPGFDTVYQSLVANYDPESLGRSGTLAPNLGTYVIISRENATVDEKLQPLIEWRSRMGFNVVHATTAQTGTTSNSIRAWLQDAYNTWDYPPEYISIVGDAGGIFPIPTFREPYYNGEGDHPYCQLSGEDLMPDAFVGRLSAEDYTTLERIVYKINGYEQTPLMTDPSWFTSACLTGDPSYSGVTCVQIMQWIKERLRLHNYTRIDTVFTPGYETQTIASLNQGRSFFAYRGYLGMSGIDSGDISALQNGWKLTYAVIPTCGTGSWSSGFSRSEAFLRGGVGTTTVTSGIGGIGTATSGTHTRYNNCFLSGVAFGAFWEGQYRLGASFTRGKIELIRNYEVIEYSQAVRYCYWNSLMGDPATELWTGVPAELLVSHVAVVPVGANMITVAVRDEGGQGIENAWVYLSMGDDIRIGGYTDATGAVEIPIDTSTPGTVSVVVTGHNLYPYQGNFTIQQAPVYVGLDGFSIDDGSDYPIDGNGDAVANPGETVGLYVSLRNFGTADAQNVVLHVESQDPNLSWLSPADVSFGSIAAQQTVISPAPVILRIYEGVPSGYTLQFHLRTSAGPMEWNALLDVPVTGPDLEVDHYVLGGVGSQLDPGDTGNLEVALENVGAYAGLGPITATLASDSYAIQVVDGEATYSTIMPEEVGSNPTDLFRIHAPTDCIPGQQAPMRLLLVGADGVRETVHFTIPVGTADSNDPTGPDAYGYWCYDHTDTGYAQAPTYQWIDINPASGGPGTSVGLTDYGANQDDSQALDLPFTFTYYGEEFDRVTACSNGWLTMGSTYLVNYRNWYLPSAGGPANMIAGFWDNLYQTGSNRVYYWHDQFAHRFIVAWDQLRNDYGGGTASFEIILYDPAYYPTATGDGIIDVMYETIQDTDSEQMYSTAGIQNADHSTGINYCYYLRRPVTAGPYTGGLALRYTTGEPGFSGVNVLPTLTDPRLLLRSEPNPWSRASTIRFHLAQPQPVTLQVYDVDGRVVRTLVRGVMPAGPHALDWNGAGDRGGPLPSGVYYYRLETPERSESRQTLIVR